MSKDYPLKCNYCHSWLILHEGPCEEMLEEE
jgi:hypothetical protein